MNVKNELETSFVDASGSEDDLAMLDEQDAREMTKLGKKQQLKRNFSFTSILGFSCIAMVTWEGELTTFIYGLENGGSAGSIIGFFVVWIGYAAVVASLSELMSMWPTSSGQYFWSYVLSSPRYARFLSYVCGWQSVIAWQAAVASATYLAATMMQGLAILNYPDYHFKLWHGTMIMYALMLLALLFNTVLAKWLPHIENGALFVHLIGFLTIIIVITVMSPYKATAHEVFGVFINSGHWSSQGVSLMVGLQGLVFAFLGADGAIHMSEEVYRASTILPWSLMGSIAINGVLGLSMLIAVLFCGGNLKAAVNSRTGFPIETIFTFATRSRAGGTGLTAIVLIAITFCVITCLAAASRELWAFARDHGLPGSTWLAKVHEGTKIPLNAVFTTVIITLLLALINIGSAIAFNAILSLAVAGFVGSYLIPLPLILKRRLREKPNKTAITTTSEGSDVPRVKGQLPWGPWKLGRLTGAAVNTFALLWCILVIFWSFWPRVQNPTPAEMNWSCLAYGAVTLLAAGFWVVDGRKRYQGPVRDAAGGEIEEVLAFD